jgi:hypothetical protein
LFHLSAAEQNVTAKRAQKLGCRLVPRNDETLDMPCPLRRYAAAAQEQRKQRTYRRGYLPERKTGRPTMSDYRNPNDPLQRDSPYDLNARTSNVASGWIAGGVFLVIVIGLAFGIGHTPNQANQSATANNTSPPAVQPSGPASRTYSPTPMSPLQSPAQTPAPAQPQP